MKKAVDRFFQIRFYVPFCIALYVGFSFLFAWLNDTYGHDSFAFFGLHLLVNFICFFPGMIGGIAVFAGIKALFDTKKNVLTILTGIVGVGLLWYDYSTKAAMIYHNLQLKFIFEPNPPLWLLVAVAVIAIWILRGVLALSVKTVKKLKGGSEPLA